MKKIFANPTMDIELFDVENIVTASNNNGTSIGEGTVDEIQTQLSDKIIYQTSLSELNIVF